MTRQELCNFICEVSGWSECNMMVLKQINKYIRERGLSYLDIARALSYYVDVLGNTLEPKYGIGIVGVIINDSRKYFAKLEEQKRRQIIAAEENKNREKIVVKYKVNPNKTIRRKEIKIDEL